MSRTRDCESYCADLRLSRLIKYYKLVLKVTSQQFVVVCLGVDNPRAVGVPVADRLPQVQAGRTGHWQRGRGRGRGRPGRQVPRVDGGGQQAARALQGTRERRTGHAPTRSGYVGSGRTGQARLGQVRLDHVMSGHVGSRRVRSNGSG